MSEENDAKGTEETTDSSTEKTSKSENVTEDAKKTDDQVPSFRLKEESDKRRIAEDNAKALQDKLDSIKTQVNPAEEKREEPKTDVNKRLDAMEATQVGHSPKVVEEAFIIAEGKGISLKEALETPAIKAYAEAVKSEEATANATPTAGRSPKVQADKPISEMSEDEHKAHFDKVVDALGQ